MKFKPLRSLRLLLLVATVALGTAAVAQQVITVASPGNIVQLKVQQSADGGLTYSLLHKGKPVIRPSQLGIICSRPQVKLQQFTIEAVDTALHDETWQPVWGEEKQIRNQYRELAIRLKDRNGSGILMQVVFRVFNDGLGYRYVFPKQEAINHIVIDSELSQFALTGDHTAFWIPGDYDTNEYLYNTTKLSAINAFDASAKEKDIAVTSLFDVNAVQTPLTMKTADGLYINLHEAALRNYPAMNLVLDKSTFTFTAHLVPDAVGNRAYVQTPFHTPWRTIIVSDKAEDLLASRTILNLNEPAAITDVSWIRPQKYVGMWWEMHIGKANWQLAGGKHGANTANVKTYIDFAAQHGFDGVLVEGWNEGWEDWIGNWKEDVFDFVTPYPDYDINELTAYAQSKGVKLIMHHETSGSATNYERWMDTAYRFMVNHGINTVKTGYVGKIIPRGEHHDGQWMVKHYERVLQKAAGYKIMVVAHEPVRPTGLHRTFPNFLASEAARGSEFNNAPALGIPPEHTTILPFTRLMGGPMDFTPGLFRFALNQFEPARTQRVRTTLCKQLALYITMYSPVQMAADLPENYNQFKDALQFIVDVPVDWDDTKILSAEPGDYIAMARKGKGTGNWFIGAITDENSRTMTLDLSFLEPGTNYEATIYRDGPKAAWDTNPTDYVIERKTVNQSTKLQVQLATSGGCAVSIIRK